MSDFKIDLIFLQPDLPKPICQSEGTASDSVGSTFVIHTEE